ncbi:NAD(P)/FAD-dependent oxidoreductase [Oceanobacillus halophilus]|uniref:FAD-binding oxidoreductase n=1 Tax=Oceanobacillus halophilus TaxID=930130 RepID=A0A494ZT36_9BACI|nr:FAD-dependent oxidoreductase [Oceanobacillus halophilus]RKQ28681.1 FAD-binding oxidoreductase [Oceanobacillus halophilus]
MRVDVVVVGGGIMGASISYHLARQGVKVMVIEKGSIANVGGASRASAGGLRENDRDLRELPLAQYSLERWKRLEEELEEDIEFTPSGQLKLFNDTTKLEKIMEDNKKKRIPSTILDRQGIKEVSTHISSAFSHGIYYLNGGHANPYLATLAFIHAAKRYGAIVKTGLGVSGISVKSGKVQGVFTGDKIVSCDKVINATGAWAPILHETLGIEWSLPISPRSPQMSATLPAPKFLGPVISIEGRKLSLKQTMDGRIRAGGGYQSDPGPTKFSATYSEESLNEQRKQVLSVLPEASSYPVDFTYYGIEAQCVDEVPILGSIPDIEGYLLATGFSGHGFTLSPGIGQVMADIVQEKEPTISIDGLTVERLLDKSIQYEKQGRSFPG